MRPTQLTSFAALLLAMPLGAHGQESQGEEDDAGPLEQTVPVADESIEVTVSDEAIFQTQEDALLDEFAYFQQLIAEKNFDAADASAKRVVEMAIRIHGPQSLETSKALSNLGLVQHNNKQFDAAIQNFTSAIEILEVVEDRLNSQLINPLKGLGAAQLGSGRPDLASKSFGRATHITHVNEGPHNIEQVELLESLAEAQVRLGDIEEARDVLNRIHALNVRHFEDDELGLLPSLMRRADWQHRAGYYNDERSTYRRIIRIIETSSGKNDPRLVAPLVKLGESFYYFEPAADGVRSSNTMSGETYFRRAIRVAEDDENFPWLEMATTKVALADYYAYFDGQSRARKIYREVWDDLSTDEDRLEIRSDMLERPVSLRPESLPRYAGGSSEASADAMLTGTVSVQYTVSSRGRAKDIQSEADPVEFSTMQKIVYREIRGQSFRPPLVDGVPVEAPNQEFIHEFLYRQTDLDDLQRAERQEEARNGR